MYQDFQKAKSLISASARIVLTMHERMDGDDGGALLALGSQLEKMGKTLTYVVKKGVPPSLSFLPGSEKIEDDISHENFDLLVIFGCSSKDRCGSKKVMALNLPIINIDHHPDNGFFGHVNLVDHKKSSVAELIYDFFLW